jgi:alpha-glucosidase (family GH31 glycosyl hydrolase)
MGGFWGDPTPELFVRWSQCGFLSALSRFHGATPREPWRYGDEALADLSPVRPAAQPARPVLAQLRMGSVG